MKIDIRGKLNDICERAWRRFLMGSKADINYVLSTLGWVEAADNKYGCEYFKNSGHCHKVVIAGKKNGNTIIYSYNPEIFSDGPIIGNACVGLTKYESHLFNRRMRIYEQEYKLRGLL